MSDKYHRLPNVKPESSPVQPNEIRITSQGQRKNYITYAIKKLSEVTNKTKERYNREEEKDN